jgi:hypothetical protein
MMFSSRLWSSGSQDTTTSGLRAAWKRPVLAPAGAMSYFHSQLE